MAYIEIFCSLLFVAFVFHLIKRPRIGANEPLLVPYRFPIIGHTYYFLYDTENFLKECKEKFGEPFSLYVFGSVITIAGVESTPEVLRNSDVFDLDTAVNKIFPFHDVFNQFRKIYSPLRTSKVVREQFTCKLSIYTSRIQKEVLSGIEKYFGDCKEPKVFRNIQNTLSRMVSKSIANVILGEECAQFEDIITSFAVIENEVRKMLFITPFLSFIHPSLHKYFVLYCDQPITFVLPFKFGWNPMIKHRNLFVQHCKPIIEKRIRQRRELGEKYNQKDDLLDFFISESETDVVDDEFLDNLFGELYFLGFVSINTTAQSISGALFDYGGRSELWKEIYEEQLKIHIESNGDLTTEVVNKMIKLECFLKESFRYSTGIANLPHTVIDSYTFSNGTTISKGRDVYLYMRDTAFNTKYFGDTSNDFQLKRYITLYPNGKIVHSSATKIDRSFIKFGGGKHVCPGRFFAVNTIKIYLHHLILRYNIRTEGGKIDPYRKLSLFIFPPDSGLIVENRN